MKSNRSSPGPEIRHHIALGVENRESGAGIDPAEAEDVLARAAGQGVGPGPAFQQVVARAAEQPVCPAAAQQRVIALATEERVAQVAVARLGRPERIVAGPHAMAHDQIIALATEHQIRAIAGMDGIIAGAGVDAVARNHRPAARFREDRGLRPGGAAALDRIIAGSAVDQAGFGGLGRPGATVTPLAAHRHRLPPQRASKIQYAR